MLVRIIKSIIMPAVMIIMMYTELFGACVSCKNVWKDLKAGNKTFIDDSDYAKERAKLVAGQKPCTIVLSCSDSRVPPELVFNKGLGELFVVRVAGEVVDDVVIDSIEYAVGHFGSVLIVVMGHSHCGAVIGALNRLKENNGKVVIKSGHLDAVLIPIERAIKKAGIDIYASDALAQSIRANIRYVADQLVAQSKVIQKEIKQGILSIVGAEYSLESGKVKELFVIK